MVRAAQDVEQPPKAEWLVVGRVEQLQGILVGQPERVGQSVRPGGLPTPSDLFAVEQQRVSEAPP